MRNGHLSHWMSRDDLDTPATVPVDRDEEVDVAIVGGGLSGLWTAWALTQADPTLSVAVFEAERLGFGASGRNGGWLSAKPVGIRDVLAREHGGRAGVLEIEQRLEESIHEVVDVLGAQNIDARHGGWMQVARSASEQNRIESYLAKSRSWGVDDGHLRLLTAGEARERVNIAGVTGALYSPDNYCVDPVKMLLALARTVQRAGVRIYTSSRVDTIEPGRLTVGAHTVRARRHVVVATEGYSSRQRGQRRRMLPLNSAMLVTDQLTDDQWEQIGWAHGDGVSGAAHTYFYGQRTPDGRIAIGGRGKPYRFASGVDRDGEVDQHTIAALTNLLADLFPQVPLAAAHAWCGVLGVTRDWSPFLDNDPSSKILRMGGYAGQGLTAAHLAGRIASDLILQGDTKLSTLPWVRQMPRRWEPEPLRWIGAHGLYRIYSIADVLEARAARPRTSRLALLADKIAGR